jgi:sphinganine-1-phosphate aldolase
MLKSWLLENPTLVWVVVVHLLALCGLTFIISFVLTRLREFHLLKFVFTVVKSLPVIGGIVRREKEKAKTSVSDMLHEKVKIPGVPVFTELPEEGVSVSMLHTIVDHIKKSESSHSKGRAFGGIYYPVQHDEMMSSIYTKFASTNALYPAVFPGVRKFEAEVVAMCLKLFNAGPDGCGTMTSGGTESLLLAVKAYRELAKEKRGVRNPEMIVASTAHPALLKAAHYFGIKPVILSVRVRLLRI